MLPFLCMFPNDMTVLTQKLMARQRGETEKVDWNGTLEELACHHQINF